MAHPWHHALSSARRFGGVAEDYLALHSWFDESKLITADFRHRALRRRAEGIFMAERFFGTTLTISTGRKVPVRLIGEQHVIEDLGFSPSSADWVRCIRPEPWMGRAQPLHRTVEPVPDVPVVIPIAAERRNRRQNGYRPGRWSRRSCTAPRQDKQCTAAE